MCGRSKQFSRSHRNRQAHARRAYREGRRQSAGRRPAKVPRFSRQFWFDFMELRGMDLLVAFWSMVLSAAVGATELPSPPEALTNRNQGLVRMQDSGTGTLLFRTPQASLFREAPRVNTDVSIQVTGMVAQVTVRQGFRNPGKDWLEGVYVFPLPEDSAVNQMRMQIGERVVIGEVQEKRQAQKTYQAAKSSGRRASLVEQERPNLFTTSVANIGPGELVTIEIRYLQTLRYDSGKFSLRLPLTLTPRFIPGAAPVPEQSEQTAVISGNGWAVNTDEVPDASRITPPQAFGLASNTQMATISGSIESGFPLQALKGSYHEIAVQQSANQYDFTLQAGSIPMHRDFELEWTPKTGREPGAAVFTEELGGHTYALMMLMPPQVAGVVQQPREVIFVIDTSGSMSGTSIMQAREALLLALEKLGSEDRFNIIEFNSTYSTLFENPVPMTGKSRLLARNFVRGLNSGGGTQMAAPLKVALSGSAPEGFLKQVIFITDGSVGNENALFGMISEKLGNTRLFTVGIGSAPNSHFMRKAAEFGRGTVTYIGEAMEVREKMQELFSKIQHPVVTDIQAEWKGAKNVEMWPHRISDLYRGEPVIIAARLEQPASSLEISGMTGGKTWTRSLLLDPQEPRSGDLAASKGGPNDADSADATSISSGIGTLWARRKIESLMDLNRRGQIEASAMRSQMIGLGITHKLVTRYTSFVAVDQEQARDPSSPLKQRLVANRMPKGSQQAGFPRTATSAGAHMAIGMLLLLLAGVLWLAARLHSVIRLVRVQLAGGQA